MVIMEKHETPLQIDCEDCEGCNDCNPPILSKKKEGEISEDDDYEENYDEAVWEKYFDQLIQSKGFDLDVCPAFHPSRLIVPLTNFKETPSEFEAVNRLSKEAIKKFNNENNIEYELVEVEKVNAFLDMGFIYYITFKARKSKKMSVKKSDDKSADAEDKSADAEDKSVDAEDKSEKMSVKKSADAEDKSAEDKDEYSTFQTRAWDGIRPEDFEIEFCGLKESPRH